MGSFFSLLSNVVQEVLGQSSEKVFENNNLEINLENAAKRLESINENIYPEYARNPQEFLRKTSALWFVRKDLEAARFYMTEGNEGYGDWSRIRGGNGLAVDDPKFWGIKVLFEATEAKVQEMETAKGYLFAGVQNNTILFKNAKTNELLSAEESSEI
ncbi:hypothetical protein [Anaerospora hongkongensis]|uniref:hypothetical protein n=1 Tax=Anaerospora hongkongensis TaxID=244830 RepID=UPI002899713C|nr:hypothetical protein [Anaerospora hongkongensis]